MERSLPLPAHPQANDVVRELEESESAPPIYHLARGLTLRDTVSRQGLKPGPPNLDATSSGPVTVSGLTSASVSFAYPVSQGTIPPAFPLPAPVASSSGPVRTKHRARNARRYYKPVVSANEADTREDREGWDLTLARFEAEIDAMRRKVQDGRPSGGLVPATALAEVEKFIKEDLEQSVSVSFYCAPIHRFTNLTTRQ